MHRLNEAQIQRFSGFTTQAVQSGSEHAAIPRVATGFTDKPEPLATPE